MYSLQLADIKRIQQASKSNKLVVFVGAGVSVNSGISSWGDLIKELKSELPSDVIYSETDSLKVAQFYHDIRGHKEYLEKIKQLLKFGKASFNPLHNAILDLSPSHIITTNFDDFIEQSLRSKNLQYHIIKKDSDLPYVQHDRMVIKMHGDLEIGNIVFTEKDYLDYLINFPLIDAFVKSLFATKLVLFVGFSFNDYNLKFILNSIQNLLKEDFQPVYMLSSEKVNYVVKEYYQRKGIRVVELEDDFVNCKLKEQEIDLFEIDSLTYLPGKHLYKQLRLIKEYREKFDFIECLYDNLNACESDLPILGNGIEYFIPEREQKMWNFYSEGLQVNSPYLKSVYENFKDYKYRLNFMRRYKSKITELRIIAIRNGIYNIDGFQLLTTSFYKKYAYIFDYENSVDSFYKCDNKLLLENIQLLMLGNLNYSHQDLELPFILYKTGNYYDAYLKYKELSVQFWDKEKYVLYFLCIYNMKSIGYRATNQCKYYDEETLRKEFEKIDLVTILSRCPIDEKLKKLFLDLISYSYFLPSIRELNDLVDELVDDKNLSENGGGSINSHIQLLTGNIYRLINFGNSNYIICHDNSYARQCFNNAAAGILLSHSTSNGFNNNNHFRSTRLEKINKNNLQILLFYVDLDELEKIIKRYHIGTLQLSDDAVDYFTMITNNLLLNSNEEDIDVVVGGTYNSLIQNLVYLLLRTENSLEDMAEKLYNIYLNYQLFNGVVSKTRIYNTSDLFKLMGKLIEKYKPDQDIAIKLLDPVFKRQKSWGKPESYVSALTKVLKEYQYVSENILDIDQINNSGHVSDWLYLSALYPIVNKIVKKQILERLQNYSDLDFYCLATIYHDYKIPIFTPALIDSYIKKAKVSKDMYYNYILLQVRKDKEQKSVYNQIDKYMHESEFLTFLSDPIHFINIENLNPLWLIYCKDEEFKQLVRIEIINSKVKEAMKNVEDGKRIKSKFIRCA